MKTKKQKRGGYKLVTDSERWQREYPITATLDDMAGTYLARFRVIADYGNSKEYRMDKTGYRFTVRTID